ncbi:MAG: tetratricopeptide repeat protein [Candidatus Kapabacteria bacterium]|jgi:tetratricopeptide (TPR) repeat protein|nr:tetratricopeptide repeat protein [Candidatus Kapabacteria bacterium]
MPFYNSIESPSEYQQGLEAQKSGDNRTALSLYEKALESSPKSADVWFNVGVVKANLSQIDEAITAFMMSYSYEQRPEPLYNAAYYHIRLEEFTTALRLLKKSLQMKPDFSSALYLYAFTLLKLGRDAEAYQGYCDVLEREPDNIAARFERGLVSMRLNHIEDAIADFKQVKKINPRYKDVDELLYKASSNIEVQQKLRRKTKEFA